MRSSLVFTIHAKTMMHERLIKEDWVARAVKNPDLTELRGNVEKHYIKQIPETGGKYLRVIVNPSVSPRRVITVFLTGGYNYESDDRS